MAPNRAFNKPPSLGVYVMIRTNLLAATLTTSLLALLLALPQVLADESTPEPEQPDRYGVPEGGPDELIRFIERVLNDLPSDEAEREKALAALSEATDRVLAGNASDEQLEIVVRLKVSLLRGQTDQIKALAEKLAGAGRARAARQVQAMLLMTELREAMRGSREEALPAAEKAIGQIAEFLAAETSQDTDVQLGMMAGQVAEMIENDALAATIYKKVEQIAAKSKDPRLQPLAKSLEGAIRRLTLVGNTMEVRGTTLAGAPFDWSQYAGKTVLVDFWATWCGPCVQEIPVLKRIYEAYHEKGFDIVAISLDRERGQLEAFVKERELPWTILFEDEGRNPVADYYGVMGIPQMMLVGPDGKVVSIRARGRVLEELLEKQFGPLPEAPAQDDSEAPAQDK